MNDIKVTIKDTVLTQSEKQALLQPQGINTKELRKVFINPILHKEFKALCEQNKTK